MSREPRHYAQEMFGGLPPDEFLRPGSPLKSTAEDRATLGPSWQQMPAHDDWDSNGWANGHPVDQTDYTRDAREAALRGDNVRANYFASMALLQAQRALVEQQHLGNLIAYWTAMIGERRKHIELEPVEAPIEVPQPETVPAFVVHDNPILAAYRKAGWLSPKNPRWLDYLEDRAEQEREGC